MKSRFQNLELEESPRPNLTAVPSRDADYYLQEAAAHELEGMFEPALRSFSASLRKDTTRAEGWCGQVRCLVQLEEFREAQVWSQKAAAILPASPQTRSARAYALARSGLLEEALQYSDQAFELQPESKCPYLWLERSACLLAAGRTSSAERCMQKVRELRADADWRQREALELLAFGHHEAAVGLLNDVVAARPGRANSWLLLARGYRLLGDRTRFQKALDQAGRLRPDWDEVGRESRLGLPLPLWLRTIFHRFGGKANGSKA